MSFTIHTCIKEYPSSVSFVLYVKYLIISNWEFAGMAAEALGMPDTAHATQESAMTNLLVAACTDPAQCTCQENLMPFNFFFLVPFCTNSFFTFANRSKNRGNFKFKSHVQEFQASKEKICNGNISFPQLNQSFNYYAAELIHLKHSTEQT